jgi:molybdate transport system substrate-binding protein
MRFVLLACLLFSTAESGAATLRVSAAASLTDALNEIAAHYRQPVLFNFGASSTLARQIQEGAPADLFISADELKMDQLAQRGLVVKKSRVDILSNTLVIVVPADSRLRLTSARDLVGHTVALAQPDSVPAGIYAKEYLRRIKVWDRITYKLIPTDNVRSALAAVESGNVEAGIVYKTDALISHAVKIAYEIPRNEGPKIVYPAAVLADSNQKAAAQKFLDYLRSEPARAVFRRFGFLLP